MGAPALLAASLIALTFAGCATPPTQATAAPECRVATLEPTRPESARRADQGVKRTAALFDLQRSGYYRVTRDAYGSRGSAMQDAVRDCGGGY